MSHRSPPGAEEWSQPRDCGSYCHRSDPWRTSFEPVIHAGCENSMTEHPPGPSHQTLCTVRVVSRPPLHSRLTCTPE